jgi:hypothetical protein
MLDQLGGVSLPRGAAGALRRGARRAHSAASRPPGAGRLGRAEASARRPRARRARRPLQSSGAATRVCHSVPAALSTSIAIREAWVSSVAGRFGPVLARGRTRRTCPRRPAPAPSGGRRGRTASWPVSGRRRRRPGRDCSRQNTAAPPSGPRRIALDDVRATTWPIVRFRIAGRSESPNDLIADAHCSSRRGMSCRAVETPALSGSSGHFAPYRAPAAARSRPTR